MHLAERFGEEFHAEGPGGAEGGAARRSLTSQWLLFANASLGPAMFQVETRPEELGRQLGTLDGLLAAGPHLLAGSWGDPGWGAADCVVHAYLAYIPLFCPQVDLTPYPAVQAAIGATRNRPSYQKAMGAG
jgi:glutathione S-transferase